MRNRQDVERRLTAEIEQALARVARDPYTALYLYYTPTRGSNAGGFQFRAEAGEGQELASPLRFPINAEAYQIHNMFVDLVMRLPVCSIE